VPRHYIVFTPDSVVREEFHFVDSKENHLELQRKIEISETPRSIEPFEDETKIIVTRSRAKGPGGWSQKRYGRLMDTSVNQEAKKIEAQLIEFRSIPILGSTAIKESSP
jgi:hypothetical protein